MNVFQYAAIAERNWEENLSNISGFKHKYTFYSDFSIAEFCEVYMRDKNAVKKTFNTVMSSWKGSYKALTEIVLVLNHKAWSFAGNVDSSYLKCGNAWREAYQKLYCELYEKAKNEFYKLYGNDKEACRYYFEVTD